MALTPAEKYVPSYLSTNVNDNLASGSSITYTVSDGYKGMIVITSSNTSRQGVYLIFCSTGSGAGAISLTAIKEVTGLNIDVSTLNKVKITGFSSGAQIRINDITLVGTISV